MSRLIDQLLATDYQGRSARDVTLEVGRWLEQNNRKDVFSANPDFAREFYEIKDEIDRLNRPSFTGEFRGAFGSAVDELQASGYAIGALAAHGAEKIGIPGAAPIRDNLLRLMHEQEAEAAEFKPSVPSYENISGQHPIEDTARYLTYGAGTIVPSLLQSAASGIAGAGIGALTGTAVEPGGGTAAGAIGGALLGLAEKRLAQKAVSKLLEKGIKSVSLEQAVKALPREAVEAEAKRLAIQYGSQAALAASSIATETGSIYAENPEAPGTALAYGTLAGLLDVLPESYVLSRFFSPGEAVATEAAKGVRAYLNRFAAEAAKTVPLEGGTEAAQTLVEIAAAKHARGEPPTSFTDEDYRAAINAGIIGAVGGLGLAPISASQNTNARFDPNARIGEQVVERLPLGQMEPRGFPEFGGEIPEQDLVGRSSLGPLTRQAFTDAEAVGSESFSRIDEEPYSAFGGQPAGAPPATNLPSPVAKAVKAANEAVTRLQQAVAPQPEPIEVPQAEIPGDAPLANLIGTQVEYSGYRGTLIRDQEGNFVVLRSVGDTRPVEVAGTGKDPATMATAVGVRLLEPPNMTPKPAPSVSIPTVAPRAQSYISKVPLGELFPSDIVPRGDVNPTVFTEPGQVLAAAQIPQSNAVSQQSPATLPIRQAPEAGQGVRVENEVVQEAPGARENKANETIPLDADYQYTIQQPQSRPGDGATIPGYIQIDEIRNGVNTESSNLEKLAARGINLPVPPADLPTGQYSLAQIQQEIAKRATRPTMPTGQQQVAASGNGVPQLPPDSAPNIRRLRIFEQPAEAPREEEGPTPIPSSEEPIVKKATEESPLTALTKAVGKLAKAQSNVVVVLIDRATGTAFFRRAYGGPSNTVNIDMASGRRPAVVGRGSIPSLDADFLGGTEGRPITRILSEKLPGGGQRYSIYGIGELTQPGGAANWNAGPVASLASHPALTTAAERYWKEEAAKRPRQVREMPKASAPLEAFLSDMAAWRAENRSKQSEQAMAQRIEKFVEAQNRDQAEGRLTPESMKAWASSLAGSIEQMADAQVKQTTRISADYTRPTASTINLFRDTLRALTEDRDVDVVAFEQSMMGALNSAVQTTGLVITPQQGKKIVAFGLSSITGPIRGDTIVSLLHEAGHVVTDGLSEPLRVAFHEAIEQLPYTEARWLMNPRSLDIRLLANADPATLSPQQRGALSRLTAEEIAAAKRMNPAELTEEKMAEHLAQLGWDKSEAKGAVQRLFRFVKELWLRLAMAVQQAIKGQNNISPDLARRFVENRFLQFVHRDSAYMRDRINDLLNWIGAPATERQLIPVFPAGRDWDQRMQYVDVATGQLIPTSYSPFTPSAMLVRLKTSLDAAAKWVRDNPDSDSTPGVRMTRRGAFTAPLSSTPEIQFNTVFAAINLEEEIYRQIAASPDIGPLLPGRTDFLTDWLRLPDAQLPAARRVGAQEFAKTPDPLTGQPVKHDPAMTVDGLPSVEEQIIDRDGKPVKIQLTEAQDQALKQTIAALSNTQARVQRRIVTETDRISELERQQKREKSDFAEAAQRELDALRVSVPLREKIADALTVQKNALLAKFQPGDLPNIYPTAKYLTIPNAEATEAQIRSAPMGVVPRDLKFTDKAAFGADLSAMDAWLRVPENRLKGAIYGTISEQYRKLMDIPTGLEVAGTAAVFRRAVTGSFADEFRHGGLRALRWLGQKIFQVADVVNAHNDRMAKIGAQWSTAFADFAESVGERGDQSFKERVWNPLMRVWNNIDVSERNRLGTEQEGDLFTTMERALKVAANIEIDSEKKRAALRGLLMQTIESERQIRIVFEQYPALKVFDKEMGTHRRLISHGLVTGRRSVAQHITGLFMRMNPAWSDTTNVSAEDQRTFWEAAGDLYANNRPAFDAKIKELFGDYVIPDFAEPLIQNNVQLFDVATPEGTHKASLLRVRQAWAEADGDVTKFAERLHALEGGAQGQERRTVENVLGAFRRMFEEIKADQDAKNGTEQMGHEILPGQMMDARVANDWPAEWVSYATYTIGDNLTLLHQLARATAFGDDALAGSGELSSTIREAKRDLRAMYDEFDRHYRDGKSQKEIERLMGPDEYRVAKNAAKISSNLDKVEAVFRQMSSHSNYLSGDFRLLNDMLGLISSMMVGSPRGSAINFIGDLLGPLVALKLSRPAFRAMQQQVKTAMADIGNSVIQAFGQDSAWNIEAAKRRRVAGVTDSDSYVTWKQKTKDLGPGLLLGAPEGYESGAAALKRNIGRFASQARAIIPNLGSPLQGSSENQTLSPKLRWNLFGTSAMMTMNANIDAAYQVFTDLATRGVDYINKLPTTERAQFVRELELGIRDLDNEQLGYYGGLILNDKAAFDSMKSALETKMQGESGVGRFVAKAFRRSEAADGAEWQAIAPSQLTGIINYANTEWTLQSNFAALPPWMQSGPLRPLFIFLTWPYNAMRRFAKTFVDAEGRIGRTESGKIAWWGENSTIMDGMKAFFVLAAPATIVGSFAIDFYDKYLLGKKQNLRETSWTTAIPGYGAINDPKAFLERVGRYGSAGFATDILNQIVNYDTQRNLSLDDRIVAINAIGSMVNSLVMTPIAQRGNITYASVGRPFLQSIGGGGVLQYLQIMQNLLDLDTQDAAINARINTGNYLRAAGRELNLPIRIASGPSEVPSRSRPYLQQMELAALVNNRELFAEAYRRAVQAARDDGRDDAEKYVADNFSDRHPLRRLFRTPPSETDYRKMLGAMDQYGAGQVRAAVNSYNRYMTNWFGKKGYYGKAMRDSGSVDELLRQANRINSDLVKEEALVIP